MPFTDEYMREADHNPLKALAYLHTCALAARERWLETGKYSDKRLFNLLMDNADRMVRSSIQRPPVCEACKHPSSSDLGHRLFTPEIVGLNPTGCAN